MEPRRSSVSPGRAGSFAHARHERQSGLHVGVPPHVVDAVLLMRADERLRTVHGLAHPPGDRAIVDMYLLWKKRSRRGQADPGRSNGPSKRDAVRSSHPVADRGHRERPRRRRSNLGSQIDRAVSRKCRGHTDQARQKQELIRLKASSKPSEWGRFGLPGRFDFRFVLAPATALQNSSQGPAGSLLHQLSAVDLDGLADEETRGLGRQKRDDRGALGGRAQAPERNRRGE